MAANQAIAIATSCVLCHPTARPPCSRSSNSGRGRRIAGLGCELLLLRCGELLLLRCGELLQLLPHGAVHALDLVGVALAAPLAELYLVARHDALPLLHGQLAAVEPRALCTAQVGQPVVPVLAEDVGVPDGDLRTKEREGGWQDDAPCLSSRLPSVQATNH